MHKNTRLTPHHRQAIWTAYTQEKESVSSLARRYQVSRVTIYRALKAARAKLLKPQTGTNNRFKQAKYGMKRLAKVERSIQEKLKKQAKRYNKSYPGEIYCPWKRNGMLALRPSETVSLRILPQASYSVVHTASPFALCAASGVPRWPSW